jgi:hypothetical protein
MDTNNSPEYRRFTGALKRVLQVSHEQMKSQLETEKQQKKQAKEKASDRASSVKD